MKWFIAITLSILVIPFCHSQPLVGLSAGAGTFAMSDLKKLQTEIKSQFPVAAVTTEEFPPFLLVGAQVSWNFHRESRVRTGLAFEFGSTGGRVSYRDYSGALTADQIIYFVGIGSPISFEVFNNGKLWFDIGIRPSVSTSMLTMKFREELNGESSSQSYKFNSFNVSAEPFVKVRRNLSEKFRIEGTVGFQFDALKGKQFSKENDELYLIDNGGDPVRCDWTGARVRLGFSYVL